MKALHPPIYHYGGAIHAQSEKKQTFIRQNKVPPYMPDQIDFTVIFFLNLGGKFFALKIYRDPR